MLVVRERPHATGPICDGTPEHDFTFITTGFTGNASELRVYQTNGNTMVAADTDGNAVADFQILLNGLHTLDQNDFVL